MHPDQLAMQQTMAGLLGASQQAGYESTLVARALKHLRPEINVAALKRANNGKPLDFSMLRTAVPEFPIHLMGIHVPYVHETSLQDMFTKPLHTPIYKEFDKQRSLNGWNLQRNNYGIVTGWAQMEAVVFHTWARTDLNEEVQKGHIRLEIFSCAGNKPMTYYLEPFSDLLESIARLMPQ